MIKEIAFSFDGVPCDKYGLMVYYFADSSTRDMDLGTNVSTIEDRLSRRIDPISYGVDMNQSLSFPLIFGSRTTMTEEEVDEVLEWLTGHQQYKWLELYDYETYCDPTTKEPLDEKTPAYKQRRIRYRCHINNVSVSYVNGLPFAFSATVECDGQWGYVYPPATFTYDVSSTESTVTLKNESSFNGYLYPTMTLTFSGACKTFSIVNVSDNGREFKIDATDLDSGLENLEVEINNKNGVMVVTNRPINLYPYFNKKFLRLIKGDNVLKFKTDGGTCSVVITCEWRRKVSD